MSEQKPENTYRDPVLKKRIMEQLAGYKKLNELVLREERENLPKMTPQESKEIYEDLLTVSEQSQKQNPEMGDLDRLRVQELVERRRIFDNIAAGLAHRNDKSI